MDYSIIKNFDPKIYEALDKEIHRQEDNIELIASENYVNKEILEACGSLLTNKYAEGLPNKRYYGGCENAVSYTHLTLPTNREV